MPVSRDGDDVYVAGRRQTFFGRWPFAREVPEPEEDVFGPDEPEVIDSGHQYVKPDSGSVTVVQHVTAGGNANVASGDMTVTNYNC